MTEAEGVLPHLETKEMAPWCGGWREVVPPQPQEQGKEEGGRGGLWKEKKNDNTMKQPSIV